MKPAREPEIIELDELLTGKPTWEQVCAFWKNGEFYQEAYLVQAIRRHLRTEAQFHQLHALDLSVEDLLNGRYGGEAQETAVQAIYDDWNQRLGFKAFGS